jgi:RNA polymerase sigma-70 factor (ECF subfamily)
VESDALAAIRELYERHAGQVHGYVRRRSNRDVAEEVTQQVFLVAWRRHSDVPDDALPWLYGVARRALADQRRGAMRRLRLRERLRGGSREQLATPDLDDDGLSGALRRLSEGDREVLLLRYWEDLDPARIARVIGCSRRAASVRLHRARGRLRRELELEQEPDADPLGGACAMNAESA